MSPIDELGGNPFQLGDRVRATRRASIAFFNGEPRWGKVVGFHDATDPTLRSDYHIRVLFDGAYHSELFWWGYFKKSPG